MPSDKEQLATIEECKAALAKTGAKEKGPLLIRMANAYKALKQNSKALVYYQQAYDAGETDPDFIMRFAGDLADAGKGDEALKILEKAIASTKDQLVLARLLTKGAVVSRLLENYEPGLKMGRKALDTVAKLAGESLDVPKVQAEAHTAIGLIIWRTGDRNKALLEFEKALETYKALDDKKGLSDVYNHMGIMYSLSGETAKAMDLFERSRQILDKARIYINRGLIKLHAGDFPEAEEEFRTAIKKGHEEGYRFAVCLGQMDMAEMYLDMDNTTKARAWIDMAYKGFQEMDQDPRMAMALETMARVQLREGDVKGARASVEKAMAMAKANKAKEIEAWCHYVIGLVLMAEGDLKEAKKCLQDCLDILKKTNHVRLMGRIYMALVDVNKKLGLGTEARVAANDAKVVLSKFGAKHWLKKLDDEGY